MSDDSEEFIVSLVIATRGRPEEVLARLPTWTRAGFDEVIVVDASYDQQTRDRIRSACEESSARYVGAPRTIRDIRSLQRNLGARTARGTWILFQDDDDDAVAEIDRELLAQATTGVDWMVGLEGEHIVWHRRASFLAMGGYPEDMVAAEDGIMSNRARGHGRGGLEPDWFRSTKRFPRPNARPIHRVRSAFWYGLTVLVLVCRTHSRRDVILGDARRLRRQLQGARREPWRFVLAGVSVFARLLSPLYLIRVGLRFGFSGLKKEARSNWQGLRPG